MHHVIMSSTFYRANAIIPAFPTKAPVEGWGVAWLRVQRVGSINVASRCFVYSAATYSIFSVSPWGHNGRLDSLNLAGAADLINICVPCHFITFPNYISVPSSYQSAKRIELFVCCRNQLSCTINLYSYLTVGFLIYSLPTCNWFMLIRPEESNQVLVI